MWAWSKNSVIFQCSSTSEIFRGPLASNLVTGAVQIKTKPSPCALPEMVIRFIPEVNHSLKTESCLDITSKNFKFRVPRIRPFNSTVKQKHIHQLQQINPSLRVLRALCHKAHGSTISKCRSTHQLIRRTIF